LNLIPVEKMIPSRLVHDGLLKMRVRNLRGGTFKTIVEKNF